MQLPIHLGFLLLSIVQEGEAPPDSPPVEAEATAGPDGVAASPANPVLTPVDQLVPSNTVLHVELNGWTEIGDAVKASSLWALATEDEVGKFLAPLIEGLNADLRWFLHEHPERPETLDVDTLEKMLDEPHLGTLTFTLLESEKEEPESLILSAELGPFATPVFEMIAQSIREDEDTRERHSEREIAGRQLVRVDKQGEEGLSADLVLDGTRVFITRGKKLAETLFEESDGKLGGAEWYRQARAGLAQPSPVLTLVANTTPLYESALGLLEGLPVLFAQAVGLDPEGSGLTDEGEKETQALRRVLLESPLARSLKSLAMGWSLDDKDVVERWFVHAPGDRSGWSTGTRFTGVIEEHVALADPDADLFLSTTYDLGQAIERAQESRVRQDGIRRDLGLEITDDHADLIAACEGLDALLGISLTPTLLPALGDEISVWLDMPSGLQAIPSLGVIVEIEDPTALDTALEMLVGAASSRDEISMTTSEFKGFKVYSANLINAGLPIIPTVTRVGEQLVLTLNPMDAKGRIRGRENGKHLGASDRLAAFRTHLGQAPHGLAGWADLPAILGFTYVTLSGLLGAVPLDDEDLPLDFRLLPDVSSLVKHFGPALASMSDSEQGILLESRSTVGNPVSGLVLLAGCASLGIGAATELKDDVRAAKQGLAEKQIGELGLAMQAYRESVGGGRWPESLTQLVDRGILLEAAKLVDPADPRPRKVRTGTGDRLPLSYLLGKPEALPEAERRAVANCDLILYTRGPWYRRYGEPARLVLCLGPDGTSVSMTIPESSFSR